MRLPTAPARAPSPTWPSSASPGTQSGESPAGHCRRHRLGKAAGEAGWGVASAPPPSGPAGPQPSALPEGDTEAEGAPPSPTPNTATLLRSSSPRRGPPRYGARRGLPGAGGRPAAAGSPGGGRARCGAGGAGLRGTLRPAAGRRASSCACAGAAGVSRPAGHVPAGDGS